MNDALLIDKIAKTLCFASRMHQDTEYCVFCEEFHGQCQPEMWTTFRPEAQAVLALLKREGLLAKPAQKLLLPGLGGPLR